MAGGAHWAQNDLLRHFLKICRSRLNRSFTTTALWIGYSPPGRLRGGNSPRSHTRLKAGQPGEAPIPTHGYSRPSFGWGGFHSALTDNTMIH